MLSIPSTCPARLKLAGQLSLACADRRARRRLQQHVRIAIAGLHRLDRQPAADHRRPARAPVAYAPARRRRRPGGDLPPPAGRSRAGLRAAPQPPAPQPYTPPQAYAATACRRRSGSSPSAPTPTQRGAPPTTLGPAGRARIGGGGAGGGASSCRPATRPGTSRSATASRSTS